MRFFKILFLIILSLTAFAAFKAYQFLIVPIEENSTKVIRVDIPPGSHLGRLKSELQNQGVRIDPWVFKIWSKLRGQTRPLQVGEFEVSLNMAPCALLEHLLSTTPIQHRFTIKEGHSVFDFLSTVQTLKISEDEKLKFDSHLRNPDFLKTIEIYPATGQNEKDRYWLEGFLFPETYVYQKYDAAKTIVDSILSEFKKRVLPELNSHPWSQSPEGRFRLITLASVVEKESGLFEEQPLIASVFWNRLNKRMRLQSDPTTIYGLMPDFDGNLKRIHLTTPSKYNTYTLAELPQGPISNPGIRAIQAVLKPENTVFIYFVAKGDGTHVFAKDLASHNQNVRYYQIEKRKKAAH